MRVARILFLYCFSIICILVLNACSAIGTISTDDVDDSLPIVETFRALPDVTSIGFEWQTPARIDKISGYIIYRKNKDGQFVRIAYIKDPLSTHYYDTKLSPQTSYEYRISSVGLDSKVSMQSEILFVKTSFIDPVDFVYASQNYAKRIKIFWSPSPNPVVSKYLIQRLNNDNFVTIGYTNNRMSVEFFDENLDSGKQYTYRVIAQSYDGASSIPSKNVMGATRSIPSQVQNITASRDKQEAILVEWKRHTSKDIIGYNVYSATKEDGNYKRIAFVNGLTFIDKVQGNGIKRYYKVSAVDKYNLESDLDSQGILGETLPPPPPPNISGMINENKINISWNKLDDPRIIGYVVYRSDKQNRTPMRFDNINGLTFIDEKIEQNVPYSYYVTSIDKLGIESLPSNVITIILEQSAPSSTTTNNDSNDKQ